MIFQGPCIPPLSPARISKQREARHLGHMFAAACPLWVQTKGAMKPCYVMPCLGQDIPNRRSELDPEFGVRADFFALRKPLSALRKGQDNAGRVPSLATWPRTDETSAPDYMREVGLEDEQLRDELVWRSEPVSRVAASSKSQAKPPYATQKPTKRMKRRTRALERENDLMRRPMAEDGPLKDFFNFLSRGMRR